MKQPTASRALLFNISKGKDAEKLLSILVKLHIQIPFQQIVFTTNDTGLKDESGDLTNLMVDQQALKDQEAYEKLFKALCPDKTPTKITENLLEAMAQLKTVDHVLVTGSLHLVGAFLSVIESLE
jgi:folylpolyglutamate synthase/dihydropteroate synthase